MSNSASIQDIAKRLGSVQTNLRSDLEVTRHLFRGQPQYVVRDPLTFQTHQFSRSDYQILVALTDADSLAGIFDKLVEQGKLLRDQESEYYHFILTLHRLNYLVLPISNGEQLYKRFAMQQRRARWRQVGSFLFLRIPLVNPDAFLDRTADYVRPLFTRAALVLWMIMMLTGAAILIQRWDSFKDPAVSILANDTLLFLWVALIGLKIFHEFGHAFACKIFGGRVPEMGAFLIAFTPCAYVDASSAWGFSKVRHRVIVSLAGMYFESVVAFAALVVWCWTDDPRLSSYAHHLIVLSTAVTVGFNINPLMRYDGYYVLSDLTGIPNLRQKSIEQVQHLFKRILLGISPPITTETLRLRMFLLTYGVGSLIYKVMLVLAICTMIALKFQLLGVAMAAFLMVGAVGGSLKRMLAYLWRSQETQPVRLRAIALSLFLLVLIPAAIALVRVPGSVIVPGVVQTKDDKIIYAQVAGCLEPTSVPVGATVAKNEPVCRLRSDRLEGRVTEVRAESNVARLEYDRSLASEPNFATVRRLRLEHSCEKLGEAERQYEDLTLRSPVAGQVTRVVDGRDTGRFVKKGEELATISAGPWVVRCLATGEEIADVQPTVGLPVRVRLMTDRVRELSGRIEEVAVKGSRSVFAPALTQLGGGEIPVMPGSRESTQPLFELVVRLEDVEGLPLRHAARAMVAFDTVPQTYGAYAYRRFQQFLNRLRIN